MSDIDPNSESKLIPPHLGGAPRTILEWVLTVGFWLLTNILYGFAIIIAVIALWLKTSSPINGELAAAIMKSVSLSLLAWATALMLSSADVPRLFRYFPSIGGLKAVLLTMTFFVFCFSVIFILQDPPDLSVYLNNPSANDKLLLGSKWVSMACLVVGAVWFVVHTVSMDREMRLRDSGYHDDYDKQMRKLSQMAQTKDKAGGLKLK